MVKPWQEEEIEFLRSHENSITFQEMAKRLDRDYHELADKMLELDLGNPQNEERHKLYQDPLIGEFSDALTLMQKSEWQKAANKLKKLRKDCDIPEVIERARQLLKVCSSRLGEGDDPAGADPFVIAVFEKNRQNYEVAMSLCLKDGRHEKDERFTFLLASLHALEARAEEAIDTLTRAIAMNPKNRVYAFHDPDFEVLRSEPENASLFGLPS